MTSDTSVSYPIGTPGSPWTDADKVQWRDSRVIQRSYQDEVVKKLHALNDRFEISEYGRLSQNPEQYVMYYAKTKNWKDTNPYVLITGGVHGYETSGVQGALRFLETSVDAYSAAFNIVVIPCVSPWGYETIQRWNYKAVDPNRSFNPDGEVVPGRSFNPEAATEESSAVIKLLGELGVEQWLCHIDLHETTDTDATEFRPAKASRDGQTSAANDAIPDGFYLVVDETKLKDAAGAKPFTEWHSAMIESVRKVTHIAPADADGKLIGEKTTQEGVIAIPSPKSLGLCAGVTNATFAATTEVYPDSPKATDDICNRAQVACIEGALTQIKAHN